MRDVEELLAVESRVCSHGDTVHYAERPAIFARCEGSYLYDYQDRAFLDLQMWYSAVNLGYANKRVNDALKAQIDRLPQLASQYLHAEKIELAERLVQSMLDAFGEVGRVHFQRRWRAGGRGRAEAGAPQHGPQPHACVRRRLSRAHARRVGDHVVLPLSRKLRRVRRPRGVRSVPVLLPLSVRKTARQLRALLRAASRAEVRARVHRRVESEERPFGVRGVLHRADPR